MADGVAAAAALAEVEAALTMCQADPNQRQVFMVRERLNTLSDYAELTSKEVNDLASEFERRTMADGRIVIPAKVLKNIQVFCFWAREKTWAGQPLVAADFDAAELARSRESMRIREETTQEAPSIKPDKFSEDKWMSWKLQFVTYLSHVQGVQFAPLDYVVRTEPPPGPLVTMSQHDRELYCYPLNGRHYNLGNMMVYWLLSDVVAGTLGYKWIRDHDRSQNGRATWMALVVHYEGGGQCEKRMLAALATIKALHYKNESVFAYEDFSRKLLEAFRDLKDTDEELSEFQKVKLLLEKIQITQPRAEVAKSHVRQNFRADVDGAIAYLGNEFADSSRIPSFTNEGSPGLVHFHRNWPTNMGNMKMALSVALMEHSFSLVSMLQMSRAASPLMSLMTSGHGDKHISSKRESALASLTHHDLATSTRVEGGAEVEEEEDTITRNVRLELLVWQMNSVP